LLRSRIIRIRNIEEKPRIVPHAPVGGHQSDDEFLEAFESASVPAGRFPHEAHLRMAWLSVTRLGADAALERVTTGIRRLAAAHGHAPRYHDTLTRAWVCVVAHAEASAGHAAFDQLLATHPELLDRQLLLRHYSRERLFSPQARSRWLAPDLLGIPGGPGSDLPEIG
jgi:hypothetical protein